MNNQKLSFFKNLNSERTKQALAYYFILLLGIFCLDFWTNPSHLSFADPSPHPTSSADLGASDFERICSDVLVKSTSESSMRASYCSAAKTNKEAYSAYHSTWRVWAAVSVVCGGACVSSFAGIGNPYICAASNISASAADALITKNFQSSLMTIGGTLMGLMMNQQMNSSPSSPSPEEKKKISKDYNACLSAANAAFQAFSSYNSMKSNLNSLKSNLFSALSTEGESKNTLTPSDQAEPQTNTGSTSGRSSSSGGTASSQPVNHVSPGTSLCGTTLVSNEVSSVYACALASDTSLPKNVTTPKFSDDFKKITGNDLNQFIHTSTSPGHAIGSSLSHFLPSSQAQTLSNSMNTLEQQVASRDRDLTPPSGASYSGGRGQWGREGNSDESNLNALMGTMMGQFMSKTDGNSVISQSSMMNFGAWEKLSPEAKSENRKVSIFERVTYRYFKFQSEFGMGRN